MFSPVFDEESMISTKLPIGLGCDRKENFHKFYPQLDPTYGVNDNEFLIKQDVTFSYFETNETDKNPCKYCDIDNYKKKPNLLTRTYSNEMYVNQNKSINIMKTIDEFDSHAIKMVYNYEKAYEHTVYRINLEDDKCLSHDLPWNHSTNYFYIQDIFVNKNEIFYSNVSRTYNDYRYRYYAFSNHFTYLGDYKINDIDYLVFEKVVYTDGLNCYKCFRNRTSYFEQNEVFKNKNLIQPSKVIATFYYDRSVYSTEKKRQIPSKIELRLAVNGFDIIANLTIDITSLEDDLQSYEKYDVSKCSKHENIE